MAKRKNTVLRSKDELKRELVEQIQMLQASCDAFDSGTEAEGKRIALALRLLVHEYKQSKALLAQLGLRDFQFYDSAGPLNPANLLPEHNLISLRMNGQSARYAPMGDGPNGMRRVRFQDWWNNHVIKDTRSKYFSRRDLILHVADTDGGAHVDPALDEDYRALSRENSLGWLSLNSGGQKPLDGRPELACMRQIAYELLRTIKDFMPDYQSFVTATSPR